jgi:uncharacterized membrane protein
MQNMNGKTALGLDTNVGALVCYLGNLLCLPFGLIYSIIVVVQDKTNKLVRFHAFQSILLSASAVAIWIVAVIFMTLLAVVKLGILSMLVYLVVVLIGLGIFVAMIFAAVKGYQGQIFKIPVIGDMADKWSN